MYRLLQSFTISILLLAFATSTFPIDFDSTFGTGGKLFISFSDTGTPWTRAARIFVQPSGRIVAVGWHRQFNAQNVWVAGTALAGVASSGTLDSTFGTAGKVLSWNAAMPEYLEDVHMLSDGSFLILSQISTSNPSGTATRLVKLTANGQPHPSFNATITGTPNQAHPVVLAPASGGKIYVIIRNYSYQFTLLRLNEDGSRDESFGPAGTRQLTLNRFNRPELTRLIESEDGKLLLVGSYYDTTFQEITFLVRLDSDTNIDRSFGRLGAARVAVSGGGVNPSAVKILPNGKILIGGSWVFLGSNTFLTRLTFRGRLDYTFGTGAIVMHSYMALNGIAALDVDANGKIVAVGGAGDKAIPPDGNSKLLITRFSPTGTRETFLLTNFIPTRDSGLSDLALQPDGKILAAGFTENETNNNSSMAVARFLP